MRGSILRLTGNQPLSSQGYVFHMHLIDLEVYDEKGLLLGTVKEVLQTGAMMSMLITIFREGHFDTMPLRI